MGGELFRCNWKRFYLGSNRESLHRIIVWCIKEDNYQNEKIVISQSIARGRKPPCEDT